MYTKRLNEILQRKKTILDELKDADEKHTGELETEVETLNAEETEVRRKLALSDKLDRRGEEPDAAQRRAEEFSRTNRMTIDAREVRSTLLTNVTKTTEVGGINDPFNTVSSLVDQIAIEDMTGMGSYQEAYIDSWQAASAKTDGTAQTATDPMFKRVQINPFLLAVTSYVSRELVKQTPLSYEAKVRQGALIALRKKLGNWIAKGAGSSEIYGIYNAVNTDAGTMVQTYSVDAATIDATTLRKIVMNYGGDENVGGAARLYLNKTDLIAFGDVRGTNEKKAVYEITPDGANPNIGIIKDGGLAVPYTICSDLTALSGSTRGATAIKTMVYGDPKNYKLGLFGGYTVEVSRDYKFAEGLLTVLGEVMVGGNVRVKNGFLIVTLSATT